MINPTVATGGALRCRLHIFFIMQMTKLCNLMYFKAFTHFRHPICISEDIGGAGYKSMVGIQILLLDRLTLTLCIWPSPLASGRSIFQPIVPWKQEDHPDMISPSSTALFIPSE